jgi:hypothetical protein
MKPVRQELPNPFFAKPVFCQAWFLPSLVFAKRSFLPSLVSQAEMGCAGRHRMRQLGTRRDQQRRMARHAPNIGPGKFLHGIDEQRQPAPFAVSRPPGLSRPRGLSPWLKFLTHRLSLLKPTPADRMPTRKSPIRSWRPAVKKTCKNPQKNLSGVTCFTKDCSAMP